MSDIDLQKAWGTVLERVRSQCPPAAFNTWVKWLVPVEFDGKTIMVAATNAHCKAEVEKSLAGLIQQAVSEVIGKEIDVEYTVRSDGIFEDAAPECMRVRAAERTLLDALVQSGNTHSLPAYTLRWAPLLGADLMILWWEIWQLLAGKARESIDLMQVATALGFEDKVVSQIFADPHLGWVALDGMLALDLPLVPADCDRLAEKLLGLGIQDQTEKALGKALQLDTDALLGVEPDTVRVEHSQSEVRWKYVVDVVHELCGRRLGAGVIRLSEELHLKLTRPDDVINMPSYFLQEWRPVLGSAATVFVVCLMRAKEWTGSLNAVGYLVGEKAEVVRGWLGQESSPIRKFLNVLETKRNTGGERNPEYIVSSRRGALPLSERDMKLYERLLGLILECQELRMVGRLGELVAATDRVGEVDRMLQEDAALKQLYPSRFQELEKVIRKHLGGAGVGQKERGLAALARLKAFQTGPCKGQGGAGEKGWSLERILEQCDVNKDIASELKVQEATATPFVAWLIRSAGKQSIAEPVSIAIQNLRTKPGISPRGAPERLAELGPEKLGKLINRYLNNRLADSLDWNVVFGEHPERVRILRLADELGLQVKSSKEEET